MRLCLPLLLLFVLMVSRAEAGVCTVNSEFNTQTSIDNFSISHPGCTAISNPVVVSGSDITNLNGLAGVTSVASLNILNNPLLTSISGLSSLTSAGDINIENNPLLATLTGLNELVSSGNFRVVFSAGLTSLSAVSKLTTINGFLSIGNDPLLQDLTGLDNLKTITGQVAIGANNNLVSLNGLNNLTLIGDYLYISYNPKLTSIAALSNLTSMSHYLQLDYNTSLTSLAGLENVNLSSVSYVRLRYSDMLSMCGVKSICYFLTTTKTIHITENAAGCASPEVVLQSNECQIALPVGLTSFFGESKPDGNRLTWTTSWESGNAGFSVERSRNARQFEPIAFLDGTGNSKIENTYTFTDPQPEKQLYYRLKQIDHDQSFEYSRIISVKREEGGSDIKTVSVFPNPSRGQLSIESENRNQAFSLQTLDGKTVKSGPQLPAGPIDTSRLHDGTYVLKVGNDVFKVVVAN
ncbi:T9SS type A sorting domain-containing protein [Dyadobacter fermentans]|uniref:T9SS type A sorting domain-containing protein n=1 Tax=Dyadobacter fermentans TaxID=94254 RepID=UPI001CBA82BF|nr:T9SS type A sorting domain-containing protein [Dyadobacter fermentans]MBZ1359539.1 T9SS type A sorting domain-containing protein [Dyadobacter fermentans]